MKLFLKKPVQRKGQMRPSSLNVSKISLNHSNKNIVQRSPVSFQAPKKIFSNTRSFSTSSSHAAPRIFNPSASSMKKVAPFSAAPKFQNSRKPFSAAAAAPQQHQILSGLPEYLTHIPETKLSHLDNTLKVATQETHSQIATVGVFVDAGSAQETEQNNGVAHFLEHMAFKGTQNRTREQLEVEIENMGGSLNAFTSREQTAYVARVFKDDIGKAVNILADILQRSTYEESAIQLEKSTILREMEEVNKINGELVFDMLHSSAFQGHGLGQTILGPPENIKKMTRNHLVDYVKQFYQPNRMVLAAAGAVDHSQFCEIAQKEFGNMAKPTVEADYNAIRAPQFTGSQVLMTDDFLDQLNIAIAVEGVSWWNADYFAFRVIQTLMGSWDHTIGGGKNLSSNICEVMATEKLGKSFTGFTTCYNASGLLGAYIEADPQRADDCIWLVFNEWNRMANNIRPEEVERAKSKLKASVLMSLDGTNAICEDIGRQMLQYGRRISPAEAFVRIDAVRPEDISRIARQYCHDATPVISALGPTKYMPDYNHILEWTSWKRI